MISIPDAVIAAYEAHLSKRGIPVALRAEYRKWLRYFHDFCHKYAVSGSEAERIRLFCVKLRDKKQSESQMEQVAHAISPYFEMQRQQTQARQQHANFPVGEGAGREPTAISNDSSEGEVPHSSRGPEPQQLSVKRGSSG